MSAAFDLIAVALLAALSLELVRRLRALAGDVATLTERVHELSARLEATEQDAAAALAQADVAECVLLDKGVFDEEDLEEARARTSTSSDAQPRARDELN
jgi:hypothetical protein